MWSRSAQLEEKDEMRKDSGADITAWTLIRVHLTLLGITYFRVAAGKWGASQRSKWKPKVELAEFVLMQTFVQKNVRDPWSSDSDISEGLNHVCRV